MAKTQKTHTFSGPQVPGTFCEITSRDRCYFCAQKAPHLPECVAGRGDEYDGGELCREQCQTKAYNPFTEPPTSEESACYNRKAEVANFGGYNLSYTAEICAAAAHSPSWPPAVGGLWVDTKYVAADDEYSGFSREGTLAWCHACVHPVDGSVRELTKNSFVQANLRAMLAFDWITLMLAALVVVVTVVGELKDILLCEIAVRNAELQGTLSAAFRAGLKAQILARHFIFLPAMVAAVPMVVAFKGGDALNICFNTVAIVFMCEVDNLCYQLALAERSRRRVEHAGRVTLTDADAVALARTKMVHLFLLWLCIVGNVANGASLIDRLSILSIELLR
jgi:hypothetical protein